MRKRIWLGVWSGVVLLSSSAGAGRPGPEGWGEIFARFDSYGLPDVSTAAYVKVRACWAPRIEDPLPYDWESSGNAWLLSETRDEAGQPVRATVAADGAIVEITDPNSAANRVKQDADPWAAPAVPALVCSSGWKEAIPARDARKALLFLESEKWAGSFGADEQTLGRLFLLAYNLWQQGDETNSAALLSALAARKGGAPVVAEAAMNLVAENQYGNVYREFRRTADWTAYRDGIRALLARYPADFNLAPVIGLLLERVEERIARPDPPPADPAGMTETDLRQAAQMLGVRAVRGNPNRYAGPLVLWLVPAAWRAAAPAPWDVELEVRARGLEAIPFLLKLAKDEALTAADRATVTGDSYSYHSRFDASQLTYVDSEEVRREILRNALDNLDRPATRGELALCWMKDAVPKGILDEQEDRNEERALTDVLREFYRVHRGDSDEELAVLCLPVEYGSFNPLAQDFLMARAREAALPALEKFLLEEVGDKSEMPEFERECNRDNKTELLIRYAFIRGEEVQPLVEKYAAQMRSEGQEAMANWLEHFPFHASLGDLLAAAGKSRESKEDTFDRPALLARMELLPFTEILGPALAFAAENSDPAFRMDLANLLRTCAEKRPLAGLRATDCAAAWETLIADDRAGCPGLADRMVSDKYLLLNERLFSQAEGWVDPNEINDWEKSKAGEQAAIEFLKARGAWGREWMRARVRQRLAGVAEAELPPYPAAVPPAEPQVEEIRGRLAAVAERAEAAEQMAGLSLPERGVLAALLRSDPALNERLAALANRIERVLAEGDAGEWNRKLLAWEGKLPTLDLLEELRSCAEEMARAGKPVTCKLVRKADFGGCEVVVEAQPVVNPYQTKEDPPWKIAGYAGLVCGPDLYGAAIWRTASPPDKENWRAVQTSDSYDIQRFRAASEKFFDPALPAHEAAFAIFQTQGETP